jgi:predicted dehydrogenase
MARAAIGIIGCGNISAAYLELAPLFAGIEIVACADIVPAAAKARASQFSVRAMSVEALLADKDIAAVVNLTVPKAHFRVSQEILSAGKHLYSEKPLTLSAADARKLVRLADRRGLAVGCAPDTFLGAGAQLARRMIDKGAVGRVVAGSATFLNHGMEHWHPNPDFFYRPGAGPMFDIGPYYVTTLVSLLGPVKAVAGMASKGLAERVIISEPRRGERLKVTTPTTINAVMEFASGALVSIATSWDVWRHGHENPIEIYGTDGSMLVPDPNFFGGPVAVTVKDGDFARVDSGDGAFGSANWPAARPRVANYRALGLADMMDAVRSGREPRCSGRLAAHVVEVMEAAQVSAATRKFVKIRSTVERPAPLTAADARRLTARSGARITR